VTMAASKLNELSGTKFGPSIAAHPECAKQETHDGNHD
jgi:hypothetical protein